MLPGPVFHVELLTTARRARYYVIRTLYGLVLLAILWQNFSSLEDRGRQEFQRGYSPNELARFAQTTFISLMSAQAAAVLALTPALVAGVIADEKQRKTLHYLLASQLTGTEIVLGKLLARLLHMGVYLAIGLPVMSLLTLLGAIDPREVLLVFAGTASTIVFLAGLSILISTLARRVRDAIRIAYLLELIWLAVPPLGVYWMGSQWPILYRAVGPVLEVAYLTHPAFALSGLPSSAVLSNLLGSLNPWGQAQSPGWLVTVMATLQVAFGLVWVGLAVWRLRPASSPQEVAGRWGLRIRRFRWRLLPRPSCGNDPILWKELHVARTGGLLRIVGAVVALGVLAGLVYGLLYFVPDAFRELATYGYGTDGIDRARRDFNAFLRFVGTALYIFCGLAVAAAAAGGISSEREEDTWTSLTATMLTGTEVLRAKMLGAIWQARWPLLTLGVLWALGLAAGAVHPFGALAVVIELAVFLWFFTALGTFISLRARNTTRSLALTIGLLIALNGGYLLCCLPMSPDSPIVAAGVTPAVQAVSLLSYQDVVYILSNNEYDYSYKFRGESIAMCVISVIFYGFLALVLTAGAFSAFDVLIDRPRRAFGHPPPPPPKPRPPDPPAVGDAGDSRK